MTVYILSLCVLYPQTLQSHYCPAVSRLVKHVLDPGTSNSKVEVELGKYLDIDSEQVSYSVRFYIILYDNKVFVNLFHKGTRV